MKLKHLTANPPHTLRVNEKYTKPQTVPNLIQLVGFTNRRRPFTVDMNDRRWLAIWCQRNPIADKAGQQTLKDYWKWIEGGGAALVVGWLRERDISKFNPRERPIRTDWLLEMEFHSMPELHQALIENVIENQTLQELGIVSNEALRRLMGMGMDAAGRRALGSEIAMALKELGVERCNLGGKSTTYWILDPSRRDELFKLVLGVGDTAFRNWERSGKGDLVALFF